MKRRKVSLIVNPRDGQNITKLPDILTVLAAAGCKTKVVLKEYGSHTQELAQQAAQEQSDFVIAYGGDGTLNQVVNGVLSGDRKGKSAVGVIPGGTANLWATEIGIPTDNPVKAVLTLLNSETRSADVGYVAIKQLSFTSETGEKRSIQDTDEDSNKQKVRSTCRSRFLLMAGLGLDAMVMQGVSKPLKHRIRQLAVGLSAAKNLPDYRPFPLEIYGPQQNLLWQGEALQVVIGNTRLYADILQMTPEAYIDDDKLDICVITGGNSLGTLRQVFSLLLRHQPDDLTTQAFRGKHFSLKVPLSVALQLDGSAVKQKDYLKKAQRRSLKAVEQPESAMVEYEFEALSQVLHILVPHATQVPLFKDDYTNEHTQDTLPVPAASQQTPASEEKPEPEDEHSQSREQIMMKLGEEGRKVRVVATGLDALNGIHIVAGTYIQEGTGATKPVAIRVTEETEILNEAGERLTVTALHNIKEGQGIVVSGPKNKRSVVQGKHIII